MCVSVWRDGNGVSRKQRIDAGVRSRFAPPSRPSGALRIGGGGAAVRPERMKEAVESSRGGEVGLRSPWFGRGWFEGLGGHAQKKKGTAKEDRSDRLRDTSKYVSTRLPCSVLVEKARRSNLKTLLIIAFL